jgi:2-polyprenyl-3-methyl-5-hydroxy-6-metoxy-1,4-benzoquinol methylase
MLQLRSNRRAFSKIFEANLWNSDQTVSGRGSTLESTVTLREQLPKLLVELEVKSILDAGCGDFNWMRTVNLGGINYIGVDVVEPLIQRNQKMYGAGHRTFLIADITTDPLPSADIVLCRECLIHLPNAQVAMALQNFRAAGAKYLLATTNPAITENVDIWPGSFRPINLEIAPFNLPKPIRTILDGAKGSDLENSRLGLWTNF